MNQGRLQGYKVVRLREATYDALVSLRDRAKRLGIDGLPAGVRMDVASLSDAADLAIKAARKVIG